MDELRIPCIDHQTRSQAIVVRHKASTDGRTMIAIETGVGRMSRFLTDDQFDQLALANPRVKALLDAALDSLATGVLAAGLDDAVAPFVVALGGETGGTAVSAG